MDPGFDLADYGGIDLHSLWMASQLPHKCSVCSYGISRPHLPCIVKSSNLNSELVEEASVVFKHLPFFNNKDALLQCIILMYGDED